MVFGDNSHAVPLSVKLRYTNSMEYTDRTAEIIQEEEHRVDLVDPIEYSELLNRKADMVTSEEISGTNFKTIIDSMFDLAAGKGRDDRDTRQMVGLAAPQIGVSKRIVIIDMTASGANQEQNLVAIINPVLSNFSEETINGREGCWSCGDVCGNVPRAKSVTLSGLDTNGTRVEFTLDGFTARVAQHEVDHLDGIRFPDRIPFSELWRLHKVNPNEFEDYRSEWSRWHVLYNRADWERLRDGKSKEQIHPTIEYISIDKLDKAAQDINMDPLYVDKVRHEIGQQKLIFLAAMRDGTYIASVGLCIGEADEVEFRHHYPNFAVVYSLFVNESERGRGVASGLMDVLESEARRNKKAGIALGVVKGNQPARELYEKRGYEYLLVDGNETIKSHWDVTGDSGVEQHIIVDIVPMIKHLAT